MRIVNPATEELIENVQTDDVNSVKEKVMRARQAQPAWVALKLSERVSIIQRAAQILVDHRESHARTLSIEVGKPIKQARGEIKDLQSRISFFCQHVEPIMRTQTVSSEGDATGEEISREPLGVITHISAWNYPYFVGGNVIFPALLTGNAVVYKPSEFATLSGLALAKCLHEAGVPEAIFSPVVGTADVAQAILQSPIDGVFFTGSYATGVKIAQSIAGKMIHSQFELGGKDPTYVCEDVDVDAAAKSLADGVFYNTGQSCCSVERLYVHQSIYKAFLEKIVEYTRTMQMGDPLDDQTFLGPLTRPAQLNVLEEQVRDAVQKGARVLLGGQRLKRAGYFFEPTIIADANHEMLVMCDESFGPIIGIQSVGDDEEAIRLMNDTLYGLTAGIYCRSETRARQLLQRVNAGTVYWNCCDRVSARLPWSGRQNSGLGVTQSLEGIAVFLRPKAWHLRKG